MSNDYVIKEMMGKATGILKTSFNSLSWLKVFHRGELYLKGLPGKGKLLLRTTRCLRSLNSNNFLAL